MISFIKFNATNPKHHHQQQDFISNQRSSQTTFIRHPMNCRQYTACSPLRSVSYSLTRNVNIIVATAVVIVVFLCQSVTSPILVAEGMSSGMEPPLPSAHYGPSIVKGDNSDAFGIVVGDAVGGAGTEVAKPLQWTTVPIPATITLPPDRRVTSVWMGDMLLLYTAGDGSCYSVTGLTNNTAPNPLFGQSCAQWLFPNTPQASNGTSFISLVYDAYPMAIGVTAATALGGQSTYAVDDITQSQQVFAETPFKTIDGGRSQGMLVTRTVTINNLTIQQLMLIGGSSSMFEVFCAGNCLPLKTQNVEANELLPDKKRPLSGKSLSASLKLSPQQSGEDDLYQSSTNNPVSSWRRMTRWSRRKATRATNKMAHTNNYNQKESLGDNEFSGWGWRALKAQWPSQSFPIICAGYASAIKNGTIFISGGYDCASGAISANVYGLTISPNGTWVEMWQVSPWVMGSKMDDTFINGMFGLASFDIYLVAAVSNACGILALYSMTQNKTYSISSGAQILSHVVEDPSLSNCVGPQHFMNSGGRVMLLTSADMDQAQVQGYLSFGNLSPLYLEAFDCKPSSYGNFENSLSSSTTSSSPIQRLPLVDAMHMLDGNDADIEPEEDAFAELTTTTPHLPYNTEDIMSNGNVKTSIPSDTYLVPYGPIELTVTVGNASQYTDVGIYTTRDCIGRVPFATTIDKVFDANTMSMTATIRIDPRGVKRAFEQWQVYSGKYFPASEDTNNNRSYSNTTSADEIIGTRYSYFFGLSFLCASPGGCPTDCRDTSSNEEDETDPSRQYMYVHDPNYCAVGYAPDRKIGNNLLIDNYYHCNRTDASPAKVLEFPWVTPGGGGLPSAGTHSAQKVDSVTYYHTISEAPLFFAPPPVVMSQTVSQTLSAVLPTPPPKGKNGVLPFDKTIQALIIASAVLFGLFLVIATTCCLTWFFACCCFKPRDEEDEYLYFDDWASNPNRSNEKDLMAAGGGGSGIGLLSGHSADHPGLQKARKSEYYLRGQNLDEDIRHNRNENILSTETGTSHTEAPFVSKDHSINDEEEVGNEGALSHKNGRRTSRQYLTPNRNNASSAKFPSVKQQSASYHSSSYNTDDPNLSLPSSTIPNESAMPAADNNASPSGNDGRAQSPTKRPALPHRESLGLPKEKPPSSLGVSTPSGDASRIPSTNTPPPQNTEQLRAPSPLAVVTANPSTLSTDPIGSPSRDNKTPINRDSLGASQIKTPLHQQQVHQPKQHASIIGDDTLQVKRAEANAKAPSALGASPYSPYADSDTSSSRLTSAGHSNSNLLRGTRTPLQDKSGKGPVTTQSGGLFSAARRKRRPVGEALRSIPVLGLLLGGVGSQIQSPRGRTPLPGSPIRQGNVNAAGGGYVDGTGGVTDRSRAVDQSFESAPTSPSGDTSATSASGFRRRSRRRAPTNNPNPNSGVAGQSDDDEVQSLATTDGGGLASRNSLLRSPADEQPPRQTGNRSSSASSQERSPRKEKPNTMQHASPTTTSAAALFNNNSGSQKYFLERLLGRGGYGMVFLARRTTDGTSIALKYIKCATEADLESALNEFEILHRLRHPNIVPILDMFLNWQDGFKPVLMKQAHHQKGSEEVGGDEKTLKEKSTEKDGESIDNTPSPSPAQRASDDHEPSRQEVRASDESSAPEDRNEDKAGEEESGAAVDYYPSTKHLADVRAGEQNGGVGDVKEEAAPPPPKALPSTAPDTEPAVVKDEPKAPKAPVSQKEGTRYVAIATKFLPEGDLKRLVVHRIQITGGGAGAGTASSSSNYDSNNAQASAFVFNQSIKRFHESHIISLSIQIASALMYLHTRTPRVVHRDLKPENILMDRNGQVAVLTDFGLAHGDSSRTMGTQAGSLPYVSPEAWSGRYTEKVDVWALGCVIYGLCTMRVSSSDVLMMFDAVDDDDFVKNITYDMCNACGYSPELADLVCAMLTKSPPHRISIAESLIWLKGIVKVRSYSTSFVQQMPSNEEIFAAMSHVPTSQDSKIVARVAEFADDQHLDAMKKKYEAMMTTMLQLRKRQVAGPLMTKSSKVKR